MPLISRCFRDDKKLQDCQIMDSAHILTGAVGEHVAKIQRAIVLMDNAKIDVEELNDMRYGPSTANAVLNYKKKRRIINPAYQTQADNIVGKMTITALDAEMLQLEMLARLPNSCAGKVIKSVVA
jgi:hypothetical protein